MLHIDFQNDMEMTPLQTQFQNFIDTAPLDLHGEGNKYHAPTFIFSLAKYFLPHATLWSGLMLGMLRAGCISVI